MPPCVYRIIIIIIIIVIIIISLMLYPRPRTLISSPLRWMGRGEWALWGSREVGSVEVFSNVRRITWMHDLI